MNIHEAMKRFRREFKLTQEEVAKALGTSKQGYYLYEKDRTPSAEIIKKIALAFGVSADYLLGLTDIPNNNPNAEMIDAVENFYKTFTKLAASSAAKNDSLDSPVVEKLTDED